MKRRQAIVAVVALGFGSRVAMAQDRWPTKSIRFIVPTAPGSILDVHARRFAQHFSERLRQPVVVDNRPGASNTLGVALGAKAPPDGYTLTAGSSSALVIAPLLQKVDYDPRKDFEPIALLVQGPF